MLLCQDGFDLYGSTTNLFRRWSLVAGVGALTTATPRTGSHSLRLYNAGADCIVSRLIGSSKATFIAGFGFRMDAAGSPYEIAQFTDGSTVHLSLALDAAGHLVLYRGTLATGAVLGTTTTTYTINTWYYIELKATINDTTGSYDIHVDRSSVLAGTGVDTRNGGNASIDRVTFLNRSQFYRYDYDDFYVCDTSGTVNNNFLNPVKVVTLRPNLAGSLTEWMPNTGANFTAVTETTPDDDTSYVASLDNGLIDLYNYTNLGLTGSVKALCAVNLARKESADPASFQSTMKIGASYYTGAVHDPLITYSFHEHRWEVNPDSGVAWTVAEVDALEAGIVNAS